MHPTVLETIKEPNLIVKNGVYNNYIKLFYDDKNAIKPHLQIVKVKNDGAFYVTNLKPSKSQVKKLILEGQVIYDLSSMSDTSSADNTSITSLNKDFNPSNVHYHSDYNIKPIELEKDVVPNFEKVADLKKWIEDNLNLLGDVQIKSNNRGVHFSKSNIGRSMKGINRNSVKRNSYAGLKELVENSVYSYTKEVDVRHSKRNNGQEIYHNAFIYDGEIYGIEISIDIPKNSEITHSYAGHKIQIIKKAPEINGTKLPDLTGANISINDIRRVFNPDTNVYYQDDNLDNKRGYSYDRHNFDGSFVGCFLMHHLLLI